MSAATRASRLFTVRIWREETGDGQAEWRGKVQAVPEGDASHFGWPGPPAAWRRCRRRDAMPS